MDTEDAGLPAVGPRRVGVLPRPSSPGSLVPDPPSPFEARGQGDICGAHALLPTKAYGGER